MNAVLLKAVLVATMVATSAAPAFSQIDEMFRIFGKAVEADMRRQQERREREAEGQRLKQQQDEIRRVQIAATKRLQTALASLGFYTKAIDGDFGPGTEAALFSFQRAFDIPIGAISIEDVATVEEYARTGFRNAAEQAAATAGGYPSRAAMTEAREGGYELRRSATGKIGGVSGSGRLHGIQKLRVPRCRGISRSARGRFRRLQ